MTGVHDMMMRAAFGIVIGIALAFGPPRADAAENTRTLEHVAVIPAPVEDVWRAFTDPDEITTWMVPMAEVDLRVGGEMRTNYNPNGRIGDATTIVNRILSYEPRRMLSLRNERAPDGLPHADLFAQTWSVIYFEPVGPDRTRVRTVGMGYGEGDGWDQLREFFRIGNRQTLEMLAGKFDDPAANAGDPDAALRLLARLVGGEWIHESEREDGGVFRVRNVVLPGADGRSVVAHGWLGDADGMHDHGWTLAHLDPHSGGVRFLNVNERGAVARGDIVALDQRTLRWDWSAVAIDGSPARCDVRMSFDQPDSYRFTLTRLHEDGSSTPMVDIRFRRVDEAPARFKTIKEADASAR